MENVGVVFLPFPPELRQVQQHRVEHILNFLLLRNQVVPEMGEMSVLEIGRLDEFRNDQGHLLAS